jgi:hypothetical protein
MEPDNTTHLLGMPLEVDAEAGRHITNAARWAKFIAIVMFIACALGLMLMLSGSSAIERMMRSALSPVVGYSSSYTSLLVGILLMAGIIIVYLFYLLYSFSQKAPAAVDSQDSAQLTKGFYSLKLYFIISTSLSIAGLLLAIINLATRKLF